MAADLERKVDSILDGTSRLVLAASVGGLSSCASLICARDGDDFLFFTLNPTRMADQIAFNPRVQASLWPAGEDGIRSLRVDGYCERIRQPQEIARARQKILAVTDAFADYIDEELLRCNDAVGYYRIKPVRITLIDFHAEAQFETIDFPHNRRGVLREAAEAIGRRLLLWLRALRAPFFSATLVPLLLGATIAHGDLAAAGRAETWDWRLFWLALVGALAAHAGANLANDYGDHATGNDEINRAPSPFNGGSRVIQSGLLAPWQVLAAAALCFVVTIGIGLGLNLVVGGHVLAPTPLLFIGIGGCLLGAGYTLGPWRLGYRGLGELAIAIGFGPVIVLGAHYVLAAPAPGAWNWLPPLLASLPVAVFAMLIVWINQFQDVQADRLVSKNNWVVRCAALADGGIDYERPLTLYRLFGYLGFGLIALIGLAGGIDARIGTLYSLLALAPIPLLLYADRLGNAWAADWNRADADRERLPYALLRVNAITIGIHFSTGLLLVLAYSLRDPA